MKCLYGWRKKEKKKEKKPRSRTPHLGPQRQREIWTPKYLQTSVAHTDIFKVLHPEIKNSTSQDQQLLLTSLLKGINIHIGVIRASEDKERHRLGKMGNKLGIKVVIVLGVAKWKVMYVIILLYRFNNERWLIKCLPRRLHSPGTGSTHPSICS